MSDDVAAVLAKGFMARRLDWQGTKGPGFSLQEPDWPQEKLALSLGATALNALTAENFAVVAVPEGVAVAHGARLVHRGWFGTLEDGTATYTIEATQ